MRIFRLLIALAFVGAGMLLGALNPQLVVVDLGRTSISTTLGLALLVSLLIGAFLGGLILALSNLLPAKRRDTATHRPAASEQQQDRGANPGGRGER